MTAVDVEEPGTWPPDLLDLAWSHAQRLGQPGVEVPDVQLSEAEDAFRSRIGERGLLAFHCTRLPEHEREAIRSAGLQRLTKQLVRDRIQRADEHNLITADERRHAENANMFASDERMRRGREGQICFVVGRSAFDDDPYGCEPMLATWGGEAIRGGPDTDSALICGIPTIVVARVQYTADDRMFPGLGELLIARCLGAGRRHADYFLRASDVPANDILAVWQPGDPEYDRHARLPRS